MFNFNFKAGNVEVNAQFNDKVCYVLDNSGTCKSYLFVLIFNYCKSNGISASFFDYKNMDFSVSAFEEACLNQKVVIFDNADLYLNRDILDKVNAELVLISIKNIGDLQRAESGRYRVETKDNLISVERW
jgi:hypothetical protein